MKRTTDTLSAVARLAASRALLPLYAATAGVFAVSTAAYGPALAALVVAAGYAFAAVLVTLILCVPRLRRWCGIPTCRTRGCTRTGLGSTAMCIDHRGTERDVS